MGDEKGDEAKEEGVGVEMIQNPPTSDEGCSPCL